MCKMQALRGRFQQQKMADLPRDRMSEGAPVSEGNTCIAEPNLKVLPLI